RVFRNRNQSEVTQNQALPPAILPRLSRFGKTPTARNHPAAANRANILLFFKVLPKNSTLARRVYQHRTAVGLSQTKTGNRPEGLESGFPQERLWNQWWNRRGWEPGWRPLRPSGAAPETNSESWPTRPKTWSRRWESIAISSKNRGCWRSPLPTTAANCAW